MAMTGGKDQLVHTGYANYANWGTKYPIKLFVHYKTTQDQAANKSIISCGMYVTTEMDIGPWTDWDSSVDSYVSYVGTTQNTFNGTIPITFYGTYWLTENQTFEVYHNPDGTGQATIHWQWAVNSSWGATVYPSGSFNITLPTIPRPSHLSLSTQTPVMMTDLVINTNRASSAFTHTIRYRFGAAEGTVASNVADSVTWSVPDLAAMCSGLTEGALTLICTTYNGSTKLGDTETNVTLRVPGATVPSLPDGNVVLGRANRISAPVNSSNFSLLIYYEFPVGHSYENITDSQVGDIVWTPPYDLAGRIPTSATGEGRLHVVTYNGSAMVGEQVLLFNVIVPDNEETRPVFTADGLTLTPVGGLAAPFDQYYIVGLTKLSASMQATAQHATIASYSVTAAGLTASGNPCVIDHLSVSGEIPVRATVTDSRGYSTTVTKTITVVPYDTPRVVPSTGQHEVVCERCLSDGTPAPAGAYLLIKAARKYSPIMGDNHCELRFRYKLSSADGYGAWVTLIGTDDESDEITHVDANAAPQATMSYDIQISVIDTVGNESIVAVYVPTDEVAFHLKDGGKGAAFGKYAEQDGLLDVAWSIRAAGGIAPIDSYDGVDLDTLISKGGIYTGGTPSVNGTANAPEDSFGILMVVAGDGVAAQMFFAGSGNVYSRAYSGTFTAWKTH